MKFLPSFRIIPRSFFGLPIQVGAEVISGFAIFNKASAFYAVGALFTSHPLTVVEWVVNLITVFELPVFIWGGYKISSQSPLASLFYAYFYVLDAIMCTGFTIYFIVHWFVVGAKKANQVPDETVKRLVEILMRADDKKALNKSATVGQELAVTIVLTTFVLVVRLYFMLVIVGYARTLVQLNNLRAHNGYPKGSKRAKLQYLLIRPFERFWTGHSSTYAPLPGNDKINE